MTDREKKRKQRQQKKRQRMIFTVLFVLLAVFAVNGLIGLVTDGGITTSDSSQLTDSSVQPQETLPPQPTPTPVPQPNDFCILVNRANPLSEDYDVETREIICNGQKTGKQFDVRVIDKLEAMLNAAADAGYPLIVRSAHRTINYQKMLYTNKVNYYLNIGYRQAAAEAEAGKWVAVPGTSEHNLGIVVDIVNRDYTGELEQYFEESDHFKWLIENCADYGFILRYPKTKEAVTGIVYEPWHYRYVGEDVAHYIMENNLTLEEYWEDIKNGQL